jgi:hypothetical protein
MVHRRRYLLSHTCKRANCSYCRIMSIIITLTTNIRLKMKRRYFIHAEPLLKFIVTYVITLILSKTAEQRKANWFRGDVVSSVWKGKNVAIPAWLAARSAGCESNGVNRAPRLRRKDCCRQYDGQINDPSSRGLGLGGTQLHRNLATLQLRCFVVGCSVILRRAGWFSGIGSYVYGRYALRISDGQPATLTEDFCGFPQSISGQS